MVGEISVTRTGISTIEVELWQARVKRMSNVDLVADNFHFLFTQFYPWSLWFSFVCLSSFQILFLLWAITRRQGLRVRAFFHKTVRVCHVYCNFKIGFTCRITVIFGTLKDGSLLNNTLASNICFSHRNMFQNGVDALSKIVDAFLSKSSKFHLVRIIR